MNKNIQATPAEHLDDRTTGPSVFARSLGGVVACGLASIPLAIGFSMYGVIFSDAEWALGQVVIGTLVVILFAVVIAILGAVCFGMPVYALASRAKWYRPTVLLVCAVVAGVVVNEMWHGGRLFDDPASDLQFALFGLYSGVAFWFGADRWQPIK